MPDDGLRRELLDGELLVSPSPGTRHQTLSIRLSVAFQNYLAAHGGGRVWAAPLDVLLSDTSVVQPDLIVVLDEQAGLVTDAHIAGAPALLVEILSDPRLDRVRKRDLYARFGVPEYWIVDPDADRIEVYRHDGTGYGKPEIVEPGEHLDYAPLAGLSIDLASLFAR